MKSVKLAFAEKICRQLDIGLIQVLLGPRQVGKTTTLLNELRSTLNPSDYAYESFDGLSADLTRLEEVWDQTYEGRLVVLDEIQKVKNWSEKLKSLWDRNRKNSLPTRCIVLGSSSLELQKGLSESLTGRFELTRAWHWNLHESALGYKVNLEKYLEYGGYPGSYPLIKDRNRWKNYIESSIVDTVITKDILTQSHVKSPALFRQCFDIITQHPAQELSYNKLLGKLQDKGNIDLVKYYIDLFAAAYLIHPIFKYSAKPITTKSSSPKFVVLAPALSTFLKSTLDSEYRGRIFESLVGSDLLRHQFKLFYWRDGAHEVDYVFKFDKDLVALEVKSGRKKSSKGFPEFAKQFPKSKLILINFENYESFSKNPRAFLEKRLK